MKKVNGLSLLRVGKDMVEKERHDCLCILTSITRN
jgi:hypothetical protein